MANLLFKLIIHIFFRKDVQHMAIIYATLIVKGVKTFDDVPEVLKEQVMQVLIDLDLPDLAA